MKKPSYGRASRMKGVFRLWMCLAVASVLALGGTSFLVTKPAQAKPDCQFRYPTIQYPTEGQRFDLYVGQYWSLNVIHQGDFCPGCKVECPKDIDWRLRCTAGLPAGLNISLLSIAGVPAPGTEGTHPLMLEVTVTDGGTGNPCCWNYSRRNITLVVHPVGGGIVPAPAPAPPPAPAQAKPDCQYRYPTIQYPTEGQEFYLYVGEKFNLPFMWSDYILPACKVECPNGINLGMRCTSAMPAGLAIYAGVHIAGTPQSGTEGTYPLVLEVALTDDSGKPCCVNFSKRNITLVVQPVGGGIVPAPAPPPSPAPPPAPPPPPPPAAQQPSYSWLVLLLIAAVVIGGGIFAYRRFAAARAAAPPTPAAAAPTTKPKAAALAAAPPEKKAVAPKAAPARKSNFCVKCGAPLKPGANFCNKCGRKLAAS